LTKSRDFFSERNEKMKITNHIYIHFMILQCVLFNQTSAFGKSRSFKDWMKALEKSTGICYEDGSGSNRLLPHAVMRDKGLTIKKCILHCYRKKI